MVVAWDAAAKSHVYMPDADVAFEGGVLRFVGRGYDGPADEVISGSGMMVMPGLVNIHSHPSSEPMNKGLIDEIGTPGFYNSSLYEYLPIFRADAEAMPHCVRVALSELLLSGVTTLADLSMAHPGWLDLLAEAGMRVCIAPMFRSARWYTKNGHMVEYAWDEAAGEKAMAEALSLIERAEQHPSRPAVRHGGAGADRYLHRGPAARIVRRGEGARRVVADPRRAVGQRVPRDHPPAWPHADRLAGSSGAAVGALDHRPRHLPRRPSIDALAHRHRRRSAWRRPAPPSRIARPCSPAAASR